MLWPLMLSGKIPVVEILDADELLRLVDMKVHQFHPKWTSMKDRKLKIRGGPFRMGLGPGLLLPISHAHIWVETAPRPMVCYRLSFVGLVAAYFVLGALMILYAAYQPQMATGLSFFLISVPCSLVIVLAVTIAIAATQFRKFLMKAVETSMQVNRNGA